MRTFVGVLAAAMSMLSSVAHAQDAPALLRATPNWKVGDKATFQVQQSLKERTGSKEETRFLSNGQVDIEVLEANTEALVFTWHRRVDNGDFELRRGFEAMEGNSAGERIVTALARDGVSLTVRLDLKTQRAWVQNRDDLTAALRRSLQSTTSFAGDASGRHRSQSPGEQSNREPTKAQLGIQGPLVRRDNTVAILTARSAPTIAGWYVRQVATEIEDFLGVMGREYVLATLPGGAEAMRRYRATGTDTVLLEAQGKPVLPAADDTPADADTDLRVRNSGLAGGEAKPLAYDGKVEFNVATGWPLRGAIVRTEIEGSGADEKRITLRRVYLRK